MLTVFGWLVLVAAADFFERKILLAGWLALILFEREILLAGYSEDEANRVADNFLQGARLGELRLCLVREKIWILVL